MNSALIVRARQRDFDSAASLRLSLDACCSSWPSFLSLRDTDRGFVHVTASILGLYIAHLDSGMHSTGLQFRIDLGRQLHFDCQLKPCDELHAAWHASQLCSSSFHASLSPVFRHALSEYGCNHRFCQTRPEYKLLFNHAGCWSLHSPMQAHSTRANPPMPC